MKDPKNADLLRRTKAFALRIIRLSASLPKMREADVLGRQLLRSGMSVGANYREASRSRSRAEFSAKVGDSLKELSESGYWLDLLHESGIIKPALLAELVKECDELTAIFTTIHKKSRAA
ncbi:MAG: four helix bundle protein [Terrimicrobiaceae bacterium]|jgi:four helix bundle protein